MQIKKYFAVMMIALLTFMTISTGQVTHAKVNEDIGKLTVHKFEQEPDGEEGEVGDGSDDQAVPTGAIPLPGVTYKITQTHEYNADKWTEISEGGYTTSIITGADGIAVFDNLPLGRYLVNETAGPPHVNLNPETFSVDIPMTGTDGVTVNHDVHIYPKNEIIRGAVELFKENSEAAEANTGLDGVMFDLYEKDNATPIKTDLTTANGGKIQVEGLLYGEYYFKETATVEGFVVNAAEHHFKIEASGKFTGETDERGTIVNVIVKNYHESKIEKTINGKDADLPINRDTEFEYNLKITFPSDIQDYESFVVTDELDPNLAYGGTWTVDGVDASALTFDEGGQTLTWTVDDFGALAGVDSITIDFNAKVKEDAPAGEGIINKGKVDYTNESGTDGHIESNPVVVVPTAGSLTVNKVDENGKALQGAEFELRNAKGDIVGTGVGGTITWTELDYGEYTLHETKAPEGYRLLLKPINVTIEKSNVTVEVKNTKSGWELPKTGGIGTTLFSGIGILLMAAAVMIFARRRGSATLL